MANDPQSDIRFQRAVKHVLTIEGGYSNDPVDRGGATQFGISLRFLAQEGKIDLDKDGRADFDLDMDGDVDAADIRRLTRADAIKLYRRCFWERFNCDLLPAPIGEMVFDQAINGGGVAAIKMLQMAVNQCGEKLLVDGVNGPKTVSATHRALRSRAALRFGGGLPEIYRAQVRARYRQIVARDPRQRKFLRGWLNRANQLGVHA